MNHVNAYERGMKVIFKSSEKNDIKVLAEREFGYCVDTKEVYIGTPSGNILFQDYHLIFTSLYIVPSHSISFIGLNKVDFDRWYSSVVK